MNEILWAVFWVVFIILILFGAFLFDSLKCENRWPDRETKYGLTTGCMVNHKGGMVPESVLRFSE